MGAGPLPQRPLTGWLVISVQALRFCWLNLQQSFDLTKVRAEQEEKIAQEVQALHVS